MLQSIVVKGITALSLGNLVVASCTLPACHTKWISLGSATLMAALGVRMMWEPTPLATPMYDVLAAGVVSTVCTTFGIATMIVAGRL